MIVDTRSQRADLLAHLIALVFVTPLMVFACYGALILRGGPCLSPSDTGGCSHVRRHLAVYLPVYGGVIAFLLCAAVGFWQVRASRPVVSAVRLGWLIWFTSAFLALLLGGGSPAGIPTQPHSERNPYGFHSPDRGTAAGHVYNGAAG
ncbi:hypothetical protein ABJI51_16735 [Amycolatopsis sp. NEAU-NG30]|uniref:Integral membrane protein n=1 Tax=Amycolatopsis melonis TaxID=3156488 RepID=A0ABV0LEK9_9PSEU